MPSARRFPPPWTLEENNNACFIVREVAGRALTYFIGGSTPFIFPIYPATKASNSCRLAQSFFSGEEVGINSQSSGATSFFVGLDIPM